jgi:ribonuclease P protein component
MPDERYRPTDRLRTAAEYSRVLESRRGKRGRWLMIYSVPNELGHPRLGRVVSKKWGKAVVRNRIRRWIREAFRKLKNTLPAHDYVVLPVRVQGMTQHEVITEMQQILL